MNPSNSKIAAVSRRLTAFMAALVLLAALALPAYAEASGEQTTAALPLLTETTEDTNAPDALDAADAADAAAQDESLTPDTDDDTLQGDAAPAQDADPAQQDDNEATDQSEEAQPDPKAEAAAEEPQDETAAAQQENIEEAKQGEENLNDANEENAADDLQQDANAEDEILTVNEDAADGVTTAANLTNLEKGDPFSIYFLAPTDWDKSQEITVYGRLDNNTAVFQYKWEAANTGKTVADGRTLYKIDAVLGKDKSSDTCPYGGYKFIQIQQGNGNSANWVKLYGYVTNDGNWVTADELANQCIDFNKLQAQSESNVLTGETKSQWLQPLSSLKIVHTAYAGKPMRFKNESSDALTNVTAVFYDKDDTGDVSTSGKLKEVSRQNLGNIEAGKTSSVFYIPKESCAYVQFFSGNDKLGKCYNFYGEDLDEEETETPSFEYNSATACVFTYKGTNAENAWSAGTASTIYFDATFSKLSYVNTNTGDEAGYACSIPAADGNLYYCIKKTDGTIIVKNGMATKVGETDYWSVTVPEGASQILFSAWKWDNPTASSPTTNTGSATDWLDIPTIYDAPCFVADTGDNSINTGNKTLRGGYWTEKGTLHDAEKAKGTDVVDIAQEPFVSNSSTKYITSTLYDYYTDWELNGNNRDSYTDEFTEGQLSWVPFRQFDQAISEYYQKSKENIKYPIYTGHFQTDETVKTGKEEDKKKLFSKIADTLNLFGWASSGEQYKKFMAANNSELDIGKGEGKYAYTFLGIAANNLDSNGNILMRDTSNLVMPHFNEDFLTGNNSKNAKLGEVYHNVSFPFTKEEVFEDEPGVQYWWFDSSQTSLYLRQDPTTKKLYLGNDGANGATANKTDANSMNVNAGSNTDNVSTTYGFFPFNENATSVNANTYNYGYGTKLEIPFTLTSDGMVEAKENGGETKKVPIRYYFSGDDDVWVYIDGKLVLDIGGAHGKVSGIIDFDQTGNNKDSVTAYVSRVKYNEESGNEYSENTGTPTAITYKFNTGSKDKNVNNYYYSDTVSIPNLTTGTHTLTMYYMERGMWESNMAVAFNFPDHNELEVEKEVDLNAVNEIFKSSFQNRELFTFTIQNQATHYGLKEATGAGKVETADVDLTKATPTPATTTTGDGNIFRMDTDPANTGQQSLHWYAQYTDTGSQYRAKRYGILTLNKAIDISQMKYLTFKLYVKSESGQYTPAISNMYLELVDGNGKQKGGVDGATLSGTTYGTVTMKEDEWITVKLDLNKLIAENDFDATKLQKIRFGCNYQRNIYLKNFTFTSAVPDAGMVGFTTQQADIPDYGSATSGQLENATNARFTSTKEGAGTQVVDENGKFLLADGETVTFTDQFRRGSYISLNEELNETLFATSWTLYENGEPVTSMANGNKVTNPSQTPNLVDVESSGPDDERQEVYDSTTNVANSGYTQTGKANPNDANTIVFRSYSTPDAESDAAFTKLKVKYTNKVKTGSLKIVKKAAEGEKLTGDYTFTVTFTNIGGLGLETEPIPKTVTIQGTGEAIITGIPIGTRFRVEETGQTDGAHLQGVTITDCANDAAVIDNKQVHGTITEQDGAADVKIATVTFTNTKRELFDLQLTKQWKDADGKELTANLPSQIYVQLQRKKDADTEWAAVNYPADNTKDYVTITPDDSGWNYLFSGLDRKEVNTTDDGARWTYRVVEGTLDESGNFTPLEDGKTILLKGNVYTVTGGEETTDEDGKAAITLTNTLQNPKFALDVTKRSADEEENGSKKPLAGVEFKLEKLNEDGSTVDENFEAITGITNADGVLMQKGTDGKPTADKAFADLEAGTYRLTETKTAEGYSLLSAPIKVVFDKDGTCTLDGVEVEVSSNANPTDFTKNSDGSYTLALTVLNRKTPLLPHTGADAPSLWLLIGLPLAVAGLLILVFRYNKKGGRRQ